MSQKRDPIDPEKEMIVLGDQVRAQEDVEVTDDLALENLKDPGKLIEDIAPRNLRSVEAPERKCQEDILANRRAQEKTLGLKEVLEERAVLTRMRKDVMVPRSPLRDKIVLRNLKGNLRGTLVPRNRENHQIVTLVLRNQIKLIKN